MKNPFKFRFKITTQEAIDAQISKAAAAAVNMFYEKHKERIENELSEARLLASNSEYIFSEHELREKNRKELKEFVKKKLSIDTSLSKNFAEVNDIVLGSMDTVPEVDLTNSELWLIQDACWTKYALDSLINGIVDNYVDYVIGTGITVATPIEEVNEVINEFRRINSMEIKEREMVKAAFLDGEFFALMFNNAKGDVYVRKGHPKTIESIEPNPGDIETIYSYRQAYARYDAEGSSLGTVQPRYIKDIHYDEVLETGIFRERSKFEAQLEKNIVIKFIKLNDADKLRGLPPLKRILKLTKMYENFMMDRMVLNHERAKVVWIKKIIGRPNEAGNANRAVNSPRGGLMMVETEGVTYRIESAKLEASEAKEDALGLLYYIGTSVRFPLHILNQRTDQQVYASIKKADTPFGKMIDSAQFFYSRHFEDMYRYVIKQKIKAGKLKKEYTYPAYEEDSIMLAVQFISEAVKEKKLSNEEIILAATEKLEKGKKMVTTLTERVPISQDFPQYMLQDPKEMAEVLKIHKDMGIASLATLSTKAGYNWNKEKIKKASEGMVDPVMNKLQQDTETAAAKPKEPVKVKAATTKKEK